MDLRHEIPARAFINAQIIQEAIKSDALSASVQTVLKMPFYKNTGLSSYQFQNQAYIVSLLYCLIVVPKEVWGRNQADPLYEAIRDENIVPKFTILIANNNWNNKPHYWLIHYLRNSIAHANYSVNDKMQFTFWNEPSGGEPNWKVSIDSDGLMDFISKVGSLLANIGLKRR